MNNKVIFLIGTLSGGGAERVVSNLSLNLPDHIEREIVLFGEDAKIEYDYEGKITYLDRDQPKGYINKALTFINRIKKLNYIKKQNPGIPIISFLEYPNLLNMMTLDTKDSLVSVRNFMSTKHNKGLKAFVWNISIKFFYKRAKKIIVVSKQMKKDLIENYKLPKSRIKVIYNFYPIRKIQELSRSRLTAVENIIFKNPTIITVGRFSKQKGHQHLIKSFKEVKNSVPNAQLVILGEGETKAELINLANELAILDSIHFLGFQENPFKYISNSKVFVMTSYFEGFPNALAEAMACRVPIISTDCQSGPREILAPNDYDSSIDYDSINMEAFGVLVPDLTKSDAVEVEIKLADAITKMLCNENDYVHYSQKSIERVKDFDVENVIEQWLDLIESN
ncbi:glycosyltransferase [Bacillus sp. CFBP9009]